jgi:cytochrome c553
MARQRIIVDGEAATERVAFIVTPKMNRFLDAIALIHGTERTEIVRSLIADFIERYREQNGTHPVMKQIQDETSDAQIKKLAKKSE